MTRLTAFAVAGAIALSTAPAQATQPEGPDPTARALTGDALFAEMLGFIGDRTALNYFAALENPPVVHFVEVGDEMAYNGVRLTIAEGMRGLYDPTTRAITLVLPWTPVSFDDQGVLLHELVHHAQHATGPYVCAEETEWQAHLLQDAWLAARGRASGFDFNEIAEDALCH